jgi:CRP-like cAMP-binding protein
VRPSGNLMLAAFGPDIELIRPHLRSVELKAGQVLSEPGERIAHVYFLASGIASKLAVFEDGGEIECALVGRQGAVGALAVMGLTRALTRDVCHLPVRADVIEVGQLVAAARLSPLIARTLAHYCAWKTSCAVRNGACNARHAVEPRLCRWLLTCCDVLEAREIRLPQDIFAKMLGVQRTSVNPILQRLRADGLIDLGRSRLTVLDSRRLAARACECYAAMCDLEQEIWAPLRDPSGLHRRNAHSAA